MYRIGVLLAIGLFVACPAWTEWHRHTIDDSSRGADGVRLADINGDGLQDIATGWEEGNRIRVYLHPGYDRVRQDWPRVTVGSVASPEDAFFVDMNRDGVFEVVACAEGQERSVTLHHRSDPQRPLLQDDSWQTVSLQALHRQALWMFGAPIAIGSRQPALVLGAKGQGSSLCLAIPPADPLSPDGWQVHTLYPLHWVMSIQVTDMDADTDPDILFTERRGENPGLYWLENRTGSSDRNLEYVPPLQPFRAHALGVHVPEVMFLHRADMDGDGLEDIAVITREHGIHLLRRMDPFALRWHTTIVPLPEEAGAGKGIAVADFNMDGRQDIVFSCEGATGIHGVMMLTYETSPWQPEWTSTPISGTIGTKYDRIEVVDLDGDGDPDVITCEERENLGVIWYENPTRNPETKP